MMRAVQILACSAVLMGAFCFAPQSQSAKPESVAAMTCNQPLVLEGGSGRLVCADVAAFEQPIVYNRFGSFNPFGMMFALKRDLSPGDQVSASTVDANYCDDRDGTEAGSADANALEPGNVRLKDCKRPRPMVLRAAVGDVLKVRLTNLLWEEQPGFSETFCRAGDKGPKTVDAAEEKNEEFDPVTGLVRKSLPAHVERLKLRPLVSEIAVKNEADKSALHEGEFACSRASAWKSPVQANLSDNKTKDGDWPLTRGLSFAVQGLRAVSPDGEPVHKACLGLESIASGKAVDCYYAAEREGTYFVSSKASPAGGEGEGGSLTHGLFGAVVVQAKNTQWFRSQVSQKAFNVAWTPNSASPVKHDRLKTLDYNAPGAGGVPVLNMVHKTSEDGKFVELVHTDLNAIVYRAGRKNCATEAAVENCGINFREFSVFFHDELKTFFAKEFEELGRHGQLAGVRDGFAINYGASGMGTMLLANRKGIGPAADCPECLYEEFFLSSWANGDPALLEQYSDDPSNVHHSYINDRVVFRNFHAGPKETHVFHLHAHQWFAGNDPNRGSYLDSQTVGPEQGFSYDIYHGGLNSYSPKDGTQKGKGWWESLGAGNRNRGPGDSIFHCHLYPHFAQGMWELWRNHDVLEDGTRKLPDGQLEASLSVAVNKKARLARKGTVDESGAWTSVVEDASNEAASSKADGTPVPALVPLPDQVLPLLPSYKETGGEVAGVYGMPGYPFYIAGKPGHRPPQPPMDMSADEDGGLPRHVITGGKRKFEVAGAEVFTGYDTITGDYADPEKFTVSVTDPELRRRAAQQYMAKVLALGNFAAEFESLDLSFPGPMGSPLERAAMGFHYNGKVFDPKNENTPDLNLRMADGKPAKFDAEEGGYQTMFTPLPDTEIKDVVAGKFFAINGAPPKPGSPFADPCAIASGLKWSAPRRHIKDEGVHLTNSDVDLKLVEDRLYTDSDDFNPDPGMTGFRRYEVSAVQLDLITNKAGWHDPQARINVLTEKSGDYKTTRRVSANEEPFFFRARSGECIEFRHTNELPKDLELDDFQVKTPTDTIGQHIHLVKFDVTSADGSGNGWNYEDGTFAADEVVARICAAKPAATDMDLIKQRDKYCEVKDGAFHARNEFKKFWRKKLDSTKRAEQPFQTTIQRWYADPILSSTGTDSGDADSAGNLLDRTMRTVFTHDHFGPSSIQQHGFYSALIIEPTCAQIMSAGGGADEPAPKMYNGGKCEINRDTLGKPIYELADDNKVMVGVHKRVTFDGSSGGGGLPDLNRNFREYAISIADFATLYDPQDFVTSKAFLKNEPEADTSLAAVEKRHGMELLACEARYRLDASKLKSVCGIGPEDKNAEVHPKTMGWSPAWIAGGMQGEKHETHRPPKKLDLFDKYPANAHISDVEQLKEHLDHWRAAAAGCIVPAVETDGTWALDENGKLKTQNLCSDGMRFAKPVAPPERPESISVDHHDPYLVNYRGEPIPLRVGKKDVASTDGCLKDTVEYWVDKLDLDAGTPEHHQNVLKLAESECSAKVQKDGEAGDMANVFLSNLKQNVLHGDPATPLIESYDGEKVVLRMIQGAQEVQHVFNVDGFNWTRNFDQKFPAGSRKLETILAETAHQRCIEDARKGKPLEYQNWFERKNGYDPAFWDEYEKRVAQCDNVDGRTMAQEIGISEHFEFEGKFRLFAGAERAGLPPDALPGSAEKIPDLTDYLYHFGSSDDLWNGAWGLLRVNLDPEAKDFVDCAKKGIVDAECTLKQDRLPEVPQNALEAAIPEDRNEIASLLVENGLQCPTTSRRARAVAVALTARQVWGGESSYGGSLTDPDALFLASLDWPKMPDGSDWAGPETISPFPLDVAQIQTMVKSKYKNGPKPFVLDVEAGACVYLAVINAMAHDSASGKLRDLIGDALMPPITPLNVDPQVNKGLKYDTTNGKRDLSNLMPSSKLALRVKLPMLNDPGSFAMPYGFNTALALKPANGQIIFATGRDRDENANAELISFFAGRLRLPVNDDEFDKAFEIVCETLKADNPGFSIAGIGGRTYSFKDKGCVAKTIAVQNGMKFLTKDMMVLVTTGIPDEILQIDGESATPPPTTGDVSPALEAEFESVAVQVRQLVLAAARKVLEGDQVVHRVPYAFGPVPLSPVADLIGQPTHGLFGVVNIHPTTWIRVDGDDPALDGLVASLPNAVPSQRFTNGDRDMRSFTVFLQDGLGLRDKDSRLASYDSTGQILTERATPASLLKRIKPVPDCEVCDDSYDHGEKAVNYQSMAFPRMLRAQGVTCFLDDEDNPKATVITQPEAKTNFNTCKFPGDFFLKAKFKGAQVMHACAGEEIAIRVIHPGGRQRQHTFTTIGLDYDDLFPSFGFPHAALLGPGKVITASLTRKAEVGTYAWYDGTSTLRSGGIWGLLEVKECTVK